MKPLDVVRELYAAFARGEIDAVVGLLDPAVRWHEAEGSPYQRDGAGWVGPDAIVENLFQKMGSDWAHFTVLPEDFHEAGEAVVVQGRYDARHAGTGRALDCQVCHVWTVRAGRIVRFQQYVDTAQMQDVMGARE